MSETVLSQGGSRVIVARTDQGVRISVPLRWSTRAWFIVQVLAVMFFVLSILPGSLRNGAQTLGSSGVTLFLLLGGVAFLVGIVGIILILFVPSKGAVIDVTANEITVVYFWIKKSWPREKIRSIAMRHLPIGVAVVTAQIGYDQPVVIGLGPKVDARQAARELRAAMNLPGPPDEGRMLWIPGWN